MQALKPRQSGSFPRLHRGLRNTALALGCLATLTATLPLSADLTELEADPILYSQAPVDDPTSRLQRRLEQGELALAYDDQYGYLPAVLRELEIPLSSQVLVFSKTSFQQRLISPRTPRALYFNDNVSVGWVPGGEVLEVAAVDARQGAIFYTVDQRKSAPPKFVRHDECLQCHASPLTNGVPGQLIRSVSPDPDGLPIFNAGTYVTTHESPLPVRWGGWYVTGTHSRQVHMASSSPSSVTSSYPPDSSSHPRFDPTAPVFFPRSGSSEPSRFASGSS